MEIAKKFLSNRLIQLAYATFLLGCIWALLALGGASILVEDISAPYKNLNSYETTSGIIISSQITFGGARNGGWQFEIFYKYQVHGTQYVSNKVNFVSTGDDSSDAYAKSYVEKYPVGKAVTVYYEHSNPSKSVLEPENYSNSALYWTIFLSVLALLHYFFAIRFFFQGRVEIRKLDSKMAQEREIYTN